MTSNFTNPSNYQIIPELNVCSNKIINGGYVIGIGDFPPLIIGAGKSPMVWLYARSDKSNWVPLVYENLSHNSQILVVEDSETRTTTIRTEKGVIFNAVMQNDYVCLVTQLDLRSTGLDIYGDQDKLQVGNSTFAGNSFKGSKFMIGITE